MAQPLGFLSSSLFLGLLNHEFCVSLYLSLSKQKVITEDAGATPRRGTYHRVQELNVALQPRPGFAELPEEQPPDRLLVAQTAVISVWRQEKRVW